MATGASFHPCGDAAPYINTLDVCHSSPLLRVLIVLYVRVSLPASAPRRLQAH
jgi:hypothetical protein